MATALLPGDLAVWDDGHVAMVVADQGFVSVACQLSGGTDGMSPAGKAGWRSGESGYAADLYDQGMTMNQACQAGVREYERNRDDSDDYIQGWLIGCADGICGNRQDCRY